MDTHAIYMCIGALLVFICVCCVPATAPTKNHRKYLKTKTAKLAKNTWHTEGPVLVTMAGHDVPPRLFTNDVAVEPLCESCLPSLAALPQFLECWHVLIAPSFFPQGTRMKISHCDLCVLLGGARLVLGQRTTFEMWSHGSSAPP